MGHSRDLFPRGASCDTHRGASERWVLRATKKTPLVWAGNELIVDPDLCRRRGRYRVNSMTYRHPPPPSLLVPSTDGAGVRHTSGFHLSCCRLRRHHAIAADVSRPVDRTSRLLPSRLRTGDEIEVRDPRCADGGPAHQAVRSSPPTTAADGAGADAGIGAGANILGRIHEHPGWSILQNRIWEHSWGHPQPRVPAVAVEGGHFPAPRLPSAHEILSHARRHLVAGGGSRRRPDCLGSRVLRWPHFCAEGYCYQDAGHVDGRAGRWLRP